MLFYDLFRHEPDLLNVAAGDFLFKEDDQADFMYVLVSGTAHVLVGARVVEQAEAGATLGELAMIDHQSRSASVRAASDCMFARIDEKRFHFLVSQTPYFAITVMRAMAHRLRNADLMLRARNSD